MFFIMDKKEIQTSEKKRIIAAKRVFIEMHTKSVNKLEKMVANGEATDQQRVIIAFFAYANKYEKLNPLKHPYLLKLSKDFGEALTKASKEDPYYNFYKRIENAEKYKSRAKEFKSKVCIMTNRVLKETNTSIRTLSEACDIRYSNLYNFLIHEKYSELSPRKTHDLFIKTKALEEGWGIEDKIEIYSKILDKWEILKEYLKEQEGGDAND